MENKTLTFKYQYLDRNNKTKDVIVKYQLPIRAGSTGLGVQIIKYFLGIGDLSSTGPNFDPITENALVQFQEDNRQRIYDYGNYGYSSDALVDLVQGSDFERAVADELLGGASINVDLPGGFLTERGQVFEPTFKTMVDLGLNRAARELIGRPDFVDYLSRPPGSVDPSSAFNTRTEEQDPPKIGNEFVTYNYDTRITRQKHVAVGFQDIEQYFLANPNLPGVHFRSAVREVFDFYGKEKIWVINAAERTTIPIVSPAQDLVDKPDLPRKLFEEILVYQRRVESPPGFVSGQEFKFTINQMSLNEQLNGDKVDVLFGQSLLPGAKPIFASIESIVGPGPRPGATYKFKIKIRKDMFNQIRGGSGAANFGGTVDVLSPEFATNVVEGFEALEKFANGDYKPLTKEFWNEKGDQIVSSARKWRDGQYQKAEKSVKDSLRNSWNKAKTGQAGSSPEDIDKNTQDAIAAQNADTATKIVENSITNPAVYNVSELREHIEFLSEQVGKFEQEIKEFERDNRDNPTKPRPYNKFRPPPAPPMVPQINPVNESRRILNIIAVLEDFLDANGRTLKVGPNNKDELLIYHDIVKKEITSPQSVDPSLQPALADQDQLAAPKMTVEAGHRIYKVVYVDNKSKTQKELSAGLNLLTTRDPFIYPSTVSYLISLCRSEPGILDKSGYPRILKFLRPNPCRDSQNISAVIFFSRFHYPTPRFTFRKGKRKGINVEFDFDIRGIKTVEEHIKEQKRLASQSVDNLLQSTFFEQKGKVIQTADVYPKFGEIACNFEDMWRDFLHKWDPQLILCDYKKCVPGLEDLEFKFDFKFDIPALPSLPTFNPLHFVLPQIKIAFADMIMSFVCEFVKNILEAISYPDCVDALQYGAAKLSELNSKNENNPFADAKQKADMASKTSEVLNNLNIPQDVLFGEDESSIGSLFDAISLVLRPAELCDLLQGQASPGVLKVVLNVVRASDSELKKAMTTIAEVSEFFRVLGQVVDPYLCDRLREIEEVVVADALCEERSGMSGLRERLQSSGLTSAEIAREMESAQKRREALRDVAANGNFDSLLPSSNTPSKLAEKGLPGPLSNPHHDSVAKVATKAILSNIERVFTLEAPGIPDQMVEQETNLIKPGEAGFNEKDYIYYRHYTTQVANLEQNIAARKPGKLRVRSQDPVTLLQHKTSLNAINILDEEFDHIRFYFEDNSDDVEAILIDVTGEVDPEKAEQFSDLVQKHVSDYVTKYSKDEFKVFPELREISSQDFTTITRKTSSTMGSPYRELHTRIATNVLNLPLRNVDMDSKSNTPAQLSVGYSDMPFIPSKMKDCYRVSYIINDASNNVGNIYFNKVYKDRLPPEYIAMRSQSADVLSDKHPDKLLRPGGFADMFIEGLKNISENRSETNLDLYENETIRNHLSGFIDSGSSLELDADNDGEITGTERLVYLLNMIALTAASRQDGFSIYEGYVDSFNYHLTDLVKNSKYFSYNEMFQFEQDISQTFNVESTLEKDPCFVPNPKLLNFDEIVEDFLSSYKNEAEKPENDPVTRDFQKAGPYQKSIASGLFGLYVKFSCLEIVFKSMFLLSNFGPKGVFSTQFMIDYIINYVINDIRQKIVSTDLRKKVMDTVKDITLMDDEEEALRFLVRQNVNTSAIEKFVTKLFENKHVSFAEKIRNEIAENVKSVPNVDNFPKLFLRNSESSFNNVEAGEQQRLYENVIFYLELLKNQNNAIFPEMSEEDKSERIRKLRQKADTLEPTNRQAAERYRLAADNLENPDIFELTDEERLNIFIEDQRQASDLINNLNGFREVPVSAIIPNIYDKFAFEGYSEELIQKKINSGHFWMEKFYRIKNFQQFYTLYNELFLAVNSDPIFQNLPHIGTSAETSLYSEYISPEDMETLLLGSEDTNTRQEVLQVLADGLKTNQMEYDFVKSFYLKMISNFFAGRPSSEERESRPQGHKRAYLETRMKKSTVIKMMIDIGMAKQNPNMVGNSNTESGGKVAGFISSIQGYGINYDGARQVDAAYRIEPADYLTEIDYAYRSGAVSKGELIERVLYIINDVNLEDEFNEDRVMIRNWNNNNPASPEIFLKVFDTLNSYKFLGREFVFEQERYSDNPGYKYKDIPRRRKAELIVNCLTNMMDIIFNWPISTDEPQQNLKTRVFWRRDEQTQQGSGFYDNVKSLFDRLAVAKRSIDFARPWYNYYRNDGHDSMKVNVEEFPNGADDFGLPERDGTPWYKPDVRIQSDVLDYYINKAYTPTIDQSVFSDSRIRGGALSILRPVEWTSLTPEERDDLPISLFYEQEILPKQKELYDFLKDNLQVGARLMMGQKVSRQYESPPTITSEDQETITGVGKVVTEPSKIFKDFTPNFDTQKDVLNASDRTIGLFGDSSIFNRKKCFLAYAEKEELTTPNNPTGLNYKSAFYNVASVASSAINFDSTSLGKLYDDSVKDVLVYSVPIHEYIEDVKCLDDIYAETYDVQTEDRLFYPMKFVADTIQIGSDQSQTELVGLDKRRQIIKKTIYELHEDNIVKNLLSLEGIDPSVDSRPINAADVTHPANVMFDIIFPLNRYVGMHVLQNNIVFNKFKDSDDLFGATKVACLGLMGVAGTAHDVTQEKEPQLNVNELQVYNEEKGLGYYWEMFYKMIARLVKQSYARGVRTAARFGDPAYADMRKQYRDDPCDMKTGLNMGLLGGSLLPYDNFTLNKGFGTRDGKKQYVPINALPLDLLISTIPFPNYVALGQIARHIAGIPLQLDTRYGYPLGPFGLLALSAPELTSERLSTIKERKQCQDPGAPEPKGLCEDKEGEES